MTSRRVTKERLGLIGGRGGRGRKVKMGQISCDRQGKKNPNGQARREEKDVIEQISHFAERKFEKLGESNWTPKSETPSRFVVVGESFVIF